VAIPKLAFQGQVFRAHDPRWAWDPESGEGARLHGGRFNARGTPALYLSLSFEAAWAEAQQGFPFRTQPLTICTYEADCERIIDLRDPVVRKAAGVSMADLACGWEGLVNRKAIPPTHKLALELIDVGVAGILVPSFALGAPNGATNLVAWQWSRDLPNRIQCIDDEGRLGAIVPGEPAE
jgi:RES domain-containing protein